MVKLFGIPIGRAEPAPAVDVVTMPAAVGLDSLIAYNNFGGDKFAGGFGDTVIHTLNYWELRARSAQLFTENLYARGMIRRLVTNEVGTGLTPEASPDELIIGVVEDSLNAWTENAENRFSIWANNPHLCDWQGQHTYGELQAIARREAYIEGDILQVIRTSPTTGLPMVQLISGSLVQTPYTAAEQGQLKAGHSITHGVELDASKRHVAYWVKQSDLSFKRVPAFGDKSGRRIAKLIYGCDRRMDAVRGEPLLALTLQSLKEIDRYRDAVLRRTVINSMLAMWVKKGEDKMGSLPITGGAVRRDAVTVADGDGKTRSFNIAKKIPGMVVEELQQGEEPVSFNSNTDLNFGEFEKAIIQAIAWANEVPPEIMTLAFSNNYSASQAAINEFKIYLNRVWGNWGDNFCSPIYVEWLISEVLAGKIKAPGFLDAWRDPSKYDVYGAWISCDWYGSIKPSTDMLKQVKASDLLVAGGYSTRARESRITTGTKYSKNIKRLKRENELLVEAATPLAEFKKKYGEKEADGALTGVAAALEDRILSIVDDAMDAHAPAGKG